MHISTLLARPLLLLGAGREGLASATLLRSRGYRQPIHVLSDQSGNTVPDTWRALQLRPLDSAALMGVLQPDSVVIRSPGFAPAHALRRQLDALGVLQTTATRIMLAELASADLLVVGVTASKGKSTISALIHACLQPAELLGNIGTPALSALDRVLALKRPVVLELSSYQCDDLSPVHSSDGADTASDSGPCGPVQIAFGPLFPEHLDWHGSLQAYYAAKAKLLSAAARPARLAIHSRALQTLQQHGLDGDAWRRHDIAVEVIQTNPDARTEQSWWADAAGVWQGSHCWLPATRMQLAGQHNRENAALAMAAACASGVAPAHAADAIAAFRPLPYRLQDEGWHGGIRWINDSISTAPEAACAALEAFAGSARTLIAGGQDRGYDFRVLARALQHSAVSTLILLPDSGAAIAEAIRASGSGSKVPALDVQRCGNLEEAVQVAARLTPPGSTCLFSPAAPSYHGWSGFEARGAELRQHVRNLSSSPR